jgi:hypothetical protein
MLNSENLSTVKHYRVQNAHDSAVLMWHSYEQVAAQACGPPPPEPVPLLEDAAIDVLSLVQRCVHSLAAAGGGSDSAVDVTASPLFSVEVRQC